MIRFRILKKTEASKLPKGPGVYAFKKGRQILYIGKAAQLKKRVKDHFQKSGFKNELFLKEADKIAYIKTSSEIEALLLEAQLIKKYQPRFNVLWRDDKNYFFVVQTKEEFPRIFISHQPIPKDPKTKIRSIGPFVDGGAIKTSLKILRKVFPYRSCRILPKKPCLWYQLKRCLAPCQFQTNDLAFSRNKVFQRAKERLRKEHRSSTRNIVKVLQAKKHQVIKDLKKSMKKAARDQNFEGAARLRNQIQALERIFSQNLALFLQFSAGPKTDKIPDWKALQKELKGMFGQSIKTVEGYDVSNIQGQRATGSLVTFVKGQADKNLYRRFRIKTKKGPSDLAMTKEILERRLAHPEWPYPDLILIDGGLAQLNVALSVLEKLRQKRKIKRIRVISLAKRGKKFHLDNKKMILFQDLAAELAHLFLRIQDEAHRFAIFYHRKLSERLLIRK